MLIALIAAAFASQLHEGKVHWLDAKGAVAAEAYVFDNGADYPSEGLARFVRGGKVGFVDGEAREVIAATWDWADRFRGGRARVCAGCAPVPLGEHFEVHGGEWAVIDRAGKLVLGLGASLPVSCRAAGKTRKGGVRLD